MVYAINMTPGRSLIHYYALGNIPKHICSTVYTMNMKYTKQIGSTISTMNMKYIMQIGSTIYTMSMGMLFHLRTLNIISNMSPCSVLGLWQWHLHLQLPDQMMCFLHDIREAHTSTTWALADPHTCWPWAYTPLGNTGNMPSSPLPAPQSHSAVITVAYTVSLRQARTFRCGYPRPGHTWRSCRKNEGYPTCHYTVRSWSGVRVNLTVGWWNRLLWHNGEFLRFPSSTIGHSIELSYDDEIM